MEILLWLGIGLGIGFFANWKIPPKNRNGTLTTLACATLGALAGGIFSTGSSAESQAVVSGISLVFAVGGALLALLAVQLLKATLYIEH